LIVVSGIFLAFPIFARGAIKIIWTYIAVEWFINHETMNTYIIDIFGSILPILFQISSLIFGYIRSRKSKVNNNSINEQ